MNEIKCDKCGEDITNKFSEPVFDEDENKIYEFCEKCLKKLLEKGENEQ